MTPEEIAEQEAATAAAAAEAEAKAKADAASQDPIQQELDKVAKKGEGKTELEKAVFTRKKLDERIATLQGDQGTVELEDDDDTPLTIGKFNQLQREHARKTAIELAEQIEDQRERELTLHYLDRVKPSGNPQEDLRFARLAVNSVRNGQIAEEVNRTPTARITAAGGSSAGKPPEGMFEPTQEEATYMRPPFNLTKEQVIAARQAQG